MSRRVYVSDYSVRGRWAQISYPGGEITLPNKEISEVDPYYQEEVLTLATAVCREHARRWERAWKYRLIREDFARHLVEYLAEVDLRTTPRTLPQKIQQAQFKYVVAWWFEGDQIRVMEWERELVWEGVYNTPSESPITGSDIPASLMQEMLLGVPRVSSHLEDGAEVVVVPM